MAEIPTASAAVAPPTKAVTGIPASGRDPVQLRVWLFGLLLVAAVFTAYWPAMHGELVWDDDSWTTGLSTYHRDLAGLWTMWSTPTSLQQYYPLSATTFWFDHQLWGFNTFPYHVENVLLHCVAVLLFWRLLWRLGVPGAWLAAAFLALHPVMVESVSWITERKNVLSLTFFLGAALAYVRFAGLCEDTCPGSPSVRGGVSSRWGAYALALVLFLAALLAKITAFSLAPALLLLCWWKRGRLQWRRDVAPVVPFFAVAVALGLVTAWMEKHHVGARGEAWGFSGPERCLIAGRALWFYPAKFLWPVNLSFVYPRWHLDASSLPQWFYPLAAGAVLLGLWFGRRWLGRGPVVAVWFFAGSLFPVLGFLNAYFMRFSFVCDHWCYLPSLGLLALAAATISRIAAALRVPALIYVVAALVLPCLTLLTWRQSSMFTNSETIWRRTLALNPDCWMAHHNLGVILFDRGEVDASLAHDLKALELEPSYAVADYSIGRALLQQGDLDGAIAHLEKSLEIQPNNELISAEQHVDAAFSQTRIVLNIGPCYAPAQNNLGLALLRKGQVDDAIEHFRKALENKPEEADMHYNLGTALLRKDQADEALMEFQTVLSIQPRDAEVHKEVARLLLRNGDHAGALLHYQKMLEIRPEWSEARYEFGNALLQQGRVEDALSQFQKILALEPNNALVLNNLAWIRAANSDPKFRDGAEAVRLAERACQITSQRVPLLIGTLAAAYAEAGRFEDAVATADRASELALTLGEKAVAERNRELRKSYESHMPYREPTH